MAHACWEGLGGKGGADVDLKKKVQSRNKMERVK